MCERVRYSGAPPHVGADVGQRGADDDDVGADDADVGHKEQTRAVHLPKLVLFS